MHDHIYLGVRSDIEHFYMPLDDRRRHILISGATGTGKSTLLANLFFQDANNGRGALLMDPHGELAEHVLHLIPHTRIRKTIYINPGGDSEYPVAFNPLYNVPRQHRPARASELLHAFKSIWHDSWGARLNTILYHSIAALLDLGDATLLCIPRLLLDEAYRKKVLERVEDPKVRQWWAMTYPVFLAVGPEALTPVLNRIDQFFASPIVRNVLGQPKSTIDPRHLIDNNYLVIVNLSKGLIGTEAANLLGSLIIASFGSAAMSRADIPERDRKDFSMIIDEFQNYTTNELKDFLSEARKYRLSLILAHQYFDQMNEAVRSAVIGNIGSFIVFRVGADDADHLESTFSEYPKERLTESPNFTAWARVSHYGNPSSMFRLRSPKPPKRHNHGETIIRHSRIHFARERAGVEKKIDRFLTASRFKKPKERW